MLKPRDSFAKEYHLKKIIDARGLGEVWEAASAKTHIVNSIALKIYPWVRTAGIKEIEAGFANQPYFDHSNLVSAKRLGVYNNRPYLEMHFCDNGNIGKKVLQLSESEIVKCMHQISGALAYLHENSIVHGCVKPDNILIDGNSYFLYLADLGLSMELRETIEHFVEVDTGEIAISSDITVEKGRARSSLPCFCAPELYDNFLENSSAADIWAFGASMFEMITGKLPFGFLGGEAQLRNNAILKDVQQNFSVDINSIIKKCLSKNKEDRPTAQEIEELTSDFLKARKTVVAFETSKSFDIEPTKPINNVETADIIKPVKPTIINKPINIKTAFNATKLKTDNETIKPVELKTVSAAIDSKPIDVSTATAAKQIKVDNGVDLTQPIITMEPTKPATVIETVNAKADDEPVTVTDNVEPDNLTVETVNPNINNGPTTIPPNYEPSAFATVDESQKPITDVEPLKQIFFATVKPAVLIKPEEEKKPIRWSTVLNFVVPSLVVFACLFAYIKWDSSTPEYSIVPVSRYATTPANKKDSGSSVNKQLTVSSSTYNPTKKTTTEKSNLPPVPNNNSATVPKVVTAKPPIVKKSNALIVPANPPAALPKTTQNKPALQSNVVKASSTTNVKQAVVLKPKKQKDEQKVTDHGIPKHKDSEQTIDHGIPKRKDREQKN